MKKKTIEEMKEENYIKVQNIYKKLLNNEIKISEDGHFKKEEDKKELLEKIKYEFEMALKDKSLFFLLEQEDYSSFSFKYYPSTQHCPDCRVAINRFKIKDNVVSFQEFNSQNHKFKDIGKCKSQEYKKNPYFLSKINVNSPLVIANFLYNLKIENTIDSFKEDSLETITGRKNITKKYEKNNILYTQTDNTYITIYINKNKDKIKIMDSNIEDIENNKELISLSENLLQNYIKLGTISNDIWRFMISDINNIFSKKIEIRGESIKIENLKYGNWEYKSYDNFLSNNNENIYLYGEMSLINNI